MYPFDDDAIESAMARSLELAARGEGLVEPNPMVGCVVLNDGEVVGEGWHHRFGGPHAEVMALAAAGGAARGGTLVVTLEPCRHTGKTPPCTEAVIAAGVARVVIACRDPFPAVDGGGIAELRAAGVECRVGVREADARRLMAPYLKLTQTGRPWVIAKWAMTLDGKIATPSGDSKWISGEASRAVVHRLRGRVDAVIVGAGTLAADDPLLTARPAGPRTPSRVVVAGDRPLPLDRRLWRSAGEGPVIVATGDAYPADAAQQLESLGVEIIRTDTEGLLDELGRREMTNVLVEGGAGLLGQLLDGGPVGGGPVGGGPVGGGLVDEAHAFIAPKIAGGAAAPSPVGGSGVDRIADAWQLDQLRVEPVGQDVYVSGRTRR